jgi:hypothetical protein
VIGFHLAGLELWLDGCESDIPIAIPDCYSSFLISKRKSNGLTLCIRNGLPLSTKGWQNLFDTAENWQLWRDNAGRKVFVPSRHSPPPRQVFINRTFSKGEVLGDFYPYLKPGQSIYPLQNIDMALFTNWLAETGDLILHAAGISDEEMGYAFVGPSGSGKSTLIDQLASHSPIKVLGEDQVIIRYQEGQFLIYGTPWHFNRDRCSPGGVPLKKLFFLDRKNHNGVEVCKPRPGIEYLLQNALIPYYNRSGVERIMDSLPLLAEEVLFFTAGFKIGSDLLSIIKEA